MTDSKPATDTADILLSDLSSDGILRLTMNTAERRNALSSAMITALRDAVKAAEANANARVIIIAGAGPAFCAGHDLREITQARKGTDGGQAEFRTLMRACSDLMLAITACPLPVIAEVAGVAAAAGCQLVASCDLAIAAKGAKFSTPGVHIGLFCSTPMVALSRSVSQNHAMEMLLTGEMISAARATEIGLINRVVAPQNLQEATTELGRIIASKSSLTIKTGKRAFYTQATLPLTEAYDYAAAVMVDNLLTHDAEEGIGAFIEKRDPIWRDE